MWLLQDNRKTQHPHYCKRALTVLCFKLTSYPKYSHTEPHLTILYLSNFTEATDNAAACLNLSTGSLG